MINCTFENKKAASLRHVTVDCVVVKDEKILLVKRANNLTEGGKWAIIGGFVERDETCEEVIKREVFEETGYKVDSVKFLTIRDNPDRPNGDRQNISFVYSCRALELEGKPDNESQEIGWFNLDEIPPKEEFAFDHFSNIELYNNKDE